MAKDISKLPAKSSLTHLSHLPQESFRTICDRLPALIAVYNIHTGKYSYVNFAVKKILGYEVSEFLEGGVEFVSSLMHPDDIYEISKKNAAALKAANRRSARNTNNEPIVSFEYRLRHKKGHWVWLHTDGSIFGRSDGRVESVLNVSIDISGHKETMTKLEKTNTKLETARRFTLSQQVAKVGTFEWNLKTNQVKWSPELEALHGLRPGSFSGQYEEVRKFIYPPDIKKIESAIKTAIEKNKPFSCEYRIVKKDGAVVWMLSRGEVIRNESNQPSLFVGANVDITDRKKTEDRLRAGEERYQAFIKNSSEAIWRFELDRPIPTSLPQDQQIKMMYKYAYLAEANDAMASMYGYRSAKRIIGARLNDLLVEKDPENTAYLKAFIKYGYALYNTESHETDQYGEDKYFVNSLVGVVEEGMLVRAWGTQQDVTQQHKAAKALKKSEERLALALKASKLGIWEWSLATNELSWSDQLKKIYGLKPKDKITYEKYLSIIHPRDLPRMKQTINTALKNGRAYQVEHRVIWPDGSEHWVLGQGQAFMENGKLVRMIGTSINIDERKTAEQLQIKTALLSAEHKELIAINAAKDEFIALASHQLRTPATGVKQYLGMLLEGYAGNLRLNKRQLHMLRTAYESNERQLRIVNNLLLIAQLDAGKVRLALEKADILKLIKQVIDEQSVKFMHKNQKIILEYPESGSIACWIDRDRIRMTIENIIDNASKYSKDGQPIKVILSKNDTHVVIKIKDRGVGIRKKDQEKLFQKFTRIDNSLSMSAGGTGLGLYWANKIVSLHKGTLSVNSKFGAGSTFILKLPLKKQAVI